MMESQQQTANPGFDVPEIIHPPPQFFGGFHPDGSPAPPVFTEAVFLDHGETGSADDNDAKRRRIARACDMCRRKKIKCDGRLPQCSNCRTSKTDCIFTPVERKRNPPKGAKYIEGLENRLARMEALLRLSGLLSDDEGGEIDLATLEKKLTERTGQNGQVSRASSLKPSNAIESPHGPGRFEEDQLTPGTLVASPEPDRDKEKTQKGDGDEGTAAAAAAAAPATTTDAKTGEGVEALSDLMCSLLTNQTGESRYFGSSSGFSIFSPKGIQWVNEKTGDTSFQDMVSTSSLDDGKWIYWKPEIFGDLFMRRVFQPLPPQDEAMSLLRDFFENFNCMFPLFHEATFMQLAERQYSSQPYEGSGWWASINVALAIAHRLRVMSRLVPAEEDQKGWLYLKNAMGVLTELTMRNTDLFSVQALLGMSMFLQGTPNPQPSFFLLAAAIRLSHSIGLHKRASAFNLNPAEVEQRKRVFWIGYCLDKDICLRSGRPPLQDDEDMNVDLPPEDAADNIGNIPLADGKGKINLFRLMCTFASISSRVYKRLYAVKASRQSDGELLNTIGELDKELEEWKNGIPLDFRPEHEIKASHTPLILHIVVLHFGYYNCLTTIHRMSIHHGYWTSRLSNYAIQGLNAKALNPRVFSSAALCVSAARASIHLIKYIPQGDFACVWMILYFPVSALVTLFAHLLQNPHDARARADVKLMNLVVNFLTMLVSDDGSGNVKRMLGVCAEFERIAKAVIEKAEEGQSRRKRKPATDESAEDQLAQQVNLPTGSLSSSTSFPRPAPSPQLLGRTTSSKVASVGPEVPVPPVNSSPGIPFGNVYSPPPMEMFPPNPHQMTGIPSTGADATSQAPLDGLGIDANAAVAMASFQQPFVPPDLWQMPMTLGWDWADMTSEGSPPLDQLAPNYDHFASPPLQRSC